MGVAAVIRLRERRARSRALRECSAQVPLWLPISIYPPLEAKLSARFKENWVLNCPLLKFASSFFFDVSLFISMTVASQAR